MLRILDILMTIRICCYDLVGVDSKTLVLCLLISLCLLYALYFLFNNDSPFKTRLRFKWFRYNSFS
jgi:hypothetical protein